VIRFFDLLMYIKYVSVLDDIYDHGSIDSLKTRSLPAFLRSKQRPLSTEDDLHQLYAKVCMD